MSPTLRSFHPPPARSAFRLALARTMRSAGSLLQQLADRMTPKERRTPSALTLPRLEFHADAGAPEGALYVDGVLFGHLPGVHRL
jgi:hypothetical protein